MKNILIELPAWAWEKFLDFSGYREFSISHVLTLLALAALAFTIEILFLGWKRSSLYRIVRFNDRSTNIDLISCILELSNIIKFIAIVATFGLFYKLSGVLKDSFHLDLIVSIKPNILRDIIAYIAIDFFFYLRHYALHKWEWLWRFHKFHHSASNLNMITAHRVHFVEAAFNLASGSVIFVILGYTSVLSYVWILALRYLHSLFSHSEVDWHWGFIGRYIIASPTYHKIHHALEQKHYDKNMADTFVIWDIIFGTYVDPRVKVEQLGIEDDDINNHSFLMAQLNGYKPFLTKIKGSNKFKFKQKEISK